MARPYSMTRTLGALLLLGVMIAVFIPLGNWQLRRAAERKGIMHAIEAGRNSPPVALAPDTPAKTLTNWRPATASGVWLDNFTVLLQNRNYKGRPGYWVATPLLIDPALHTAVLVLRGWLPFTAGQASVTAPDAAHADKTQTIRGTLLDHVPRLFELWSFSGHSTDALPAKLPAPGGATPQVQNLDLGAYARATGLKFIPAVMEQTSGSQDRLVRDWPLPSIDFARNNGYAMQWFSFAAIAAAAWLVVAWRAWRRYRSQGPGVPPSA